MQTLVKFSREDPSENDDEYIHRSDVCFKGSTIDINSKGGIVFAPYVPSIFVESKDEVTDETDS